MDAEKEIPKLIVLPKTEADLAPKGTAHAEPPQGAQAGEPAVVFKLSDARAEEKKRAAKERRDFIRDRLKERSAR